MDLNHSTCYRALRTRDGRFDGRFFTGVTSTGIYCRPVCPARTPKADNCVFFACAAAAEEAGFRACRRCRPETAPGTPAWQGTSATVARALRLIQAGALDGTSVVDLADRLGVGDRHLRRLFAEQLGASPLAVAQTRRVHHAKRMIEQTSLSMGRIAVAAGFANVRRFNSALRSAFDRTPTAIRKGAEAPLPTAAEGSVSLRLNYRPPLDWAGLLAFLGPRAIPGVEAVDGDRYLRTVEFGEVQGVIRVGPDPRSSSALRLEIPFAAAPYLARISDRIRDQFDLDADPAAIIGLLRDDPLLAPLAEEYPGLRVPGAWDRFELAVRAILGQQVTVRGATVLCGRLVERFGRPLAGADPAGGPARLFPRPGDLAEADIAAIGMPATRANSIRCLAAAELSGDPILQGGVELEESLSRLIALPGIGNWTAQYVCMRALREPDAFPAGDLALRKALKDSDKRPTARAVERRAEAWRPWRAYAAMLLWRATADGT